MSETKLTGRELQVVEFGTKEIVKRLDVTSRGEREIEKIIGGMLINMNTERFYVKDTGPRAALSEGER
jgi:hypothetical protein